MSKKSSSNLKKSSEGELLFEIGVEELPMHHWGNVENGEWENICRKLFSDNRLAFEKVSITTTPRRIVFWFEGIPSKQSASEKIFRGPSIDKAYDAEGKPSQALEGFMKSRGVLREALVEEKTEKGTYLVAKIEEPVKPTIKILPEVLKQLILKLAFPKNMRWESTGMRFSRPIRWIVALFDDKLIPFDIAGVTSGQITLGHRFLSKKPIRISKIGDYETLLAKQHVIICREKRQELIKNDLTKLAAKEGWDAAAFDTELVADASDLVEEPFLITGSFDKSFLALPSEVLATCMKKHQKIFACFDKSGKLEPRFVAVMNGKRNDLKKISEDYGRVLESRLRDAQFFYHEDTQKPLAAKIEKLKGIVFLGKLGTVYDKVERMKSAAAFFADDMKLSSGEKKNLVRAAELSKADLVSAMVYEFPELQGIMGREYSLFDREDVDVARAIDAQYWPKSLNMDYTELSSNMNRLGGMLAILEKADTVVGAFGAGFIPTGSQDPYALRRAAGGIVKIIRAFGFSFSLNHLIDKFRELYGSKINWSPEAETKLKAFFKERLFFELNLKPGTQPYEILQAVQSTRFDDVNDVLKRFEALRDFADRERQMFLQTAKVVERTSNILKGVKGAVGDEIKESLFSDELEKNLMKLCRDNEAKFNEQLSRKDYLGVTRFYGQVFYEPIHKFFDNVMVNVEDREVRANRQALMKKINALYVDRVADLSCLTSVDIA
ncbi:MAG: glycine--tRNA ligase subunit beta [Candidatus Omnitrophica bacterium]|nr:glycine--tRNA ligase subunit beta [Candidatus Omnitrophota bacterium]